MNINIAKLAGLIYTHTDIYTLPSKNLGTPVILI